MRYFRIDTHSTEREREEGLPIPKGETTKKVFIAFDIHEAVLSKHYMDSGLLLIAIIDFGHHHNLFMTKKRAFATANSFLNDSIHNVWIYNEYGL